MHIANKTDRNNAKENVFCKGMRWNLSSSHYERQVKGWGGYMRCICQPR